METCPNLYGLYSLLLVSLLDAALTDTASTTSLPSSWVQSFMKYRYCWLQNIGTAVFLSSANSLDKSRPHHNAYQKIHPYRPTIYSFIFNIYRPIL